MKAQKYFFSLVLVAVMYFTIAVLMSGGTASVA